MKLAAATLSLTCASKRARGQMSRAQSWDSPALKVDGAARGIFENVAARTPTADPTHQHSCAAFADYAGDAFHQEGQWVDPTEG